MDVAATLGILASIAAIVTFYYQYRKEPKENKQFAVQQFELGKAAFQRIYQKLYNFAEANNAWGAHLMQELTFRTGIDLLDRSLKEIYTDQNLQSLTNKSISGKQLDDMTARLTDNYKQVINIETHFDLYVKDAPLVYL